MGRRGSRISLQKFQEVSPSLNERTGFGTSSSPRVSAFSRDLELVWKMSTVGQSGFLSHHRQHMLKLFDRFLQFAQRGLIKTNPGEHSDVLTNQEFNPAYLVLWVKTLQRHRRWLSCVAPVFWDANEVNRRIEKVMVADG